MKILSAIKSLCLSAILLVCIFSSCKKLVEIPPNPLNKISATSLFADSASIMSAVAGVYNNFGVATGQGPTFGSGSITQLTAMSADELVDNSGFNSPFFANALLPNNGDVGNLWSNAYFNIYQVNACLEGISGSTAISTALKAQLMGELAVVRSFYYFNLVNLYGGVPLVLVTNYNTSAYLPRASIAEVYKQIITDLSDARGKLKAGYPSTGHARPNLYTASALLAKVYLYQGQWQNALNTSSQVLNSGLYQLEDNLDHVFLEGSTEAIWQLPANGNYAQTPEAQLFVPYSTEIVPDFSLTTSLSNAFEPGDLRYKQWVNANTVNINGSSQLYLYPYKYKNTSNPSKTTEAYMILRLADLLLIRSEANAQLNNLQNAVEDLNTVRKRAGLNELSITDKGAALRAIAHERQVEMFCEWGSRWYDLKRTGTANSVLEVLKPGWDSHDALYPIPLTETRLNPALTQNQGY